MAVMSMSMHILKPKECLLPQNAQVIALDLKIFEEKFIILFLKT